MSKKARNQPTNEQCIDISFETSVNQMFGGSSKEFQSNIINALSNKTICDVIFEIPTDHDRHKKLPDDKLTTIKEYQVIGALFAIYSPVFRQMLFGAMSKANHTHRSIRIPDTDTETFEYFQQYFYGLYPKLSVQEPKKIVNILYFADKYMINEIAECCIKCIISHYIKTLDYLSPISASALFIILFEKGLMNMIEEQFLPELKRKLQKGYHLLNSWLECETFHQFPLRLFELFMFDKNLSIVKKCNNTYTTEDKLWECCLKWAKTKMTMIDMESDSDNKQNDCDDQFSHLILSFRSLYNICVF